MEAMLKATEVAQLMGCSKEYVTRMAREGRLEHEKTLNERNRPMLLSRSAVWSLSYSRNTTRS